MDALEGPKRWVVKIFEKYFPLKFLGAFTEIRLTLISACRFKSEEVPNWTNNKLQKINHCDKLEAQEHKYREELDAAEERVQEATHQTRIYQRKLIEIR